MKYNKPGQWSQKWREKKSTNSMTKSTYFGTECMWWWIRKQPHPAPEVGP